MSDTQSCEEMKETHPSHKQFSVVSVSQSVETLLRHHPNHNQRQYPESYCKGRIRSSAVSVGEVRLAEAGEEAEKSWVSFWKGRR